MIADELLTADQVGELSQEVVDAGEVEELVGEVWSQWELPCDGDGRSVGNQL